MRVYPQIEPPNSSDTMKDIGLPIILVVATIIGSIIGAIILGTIHIIGFDWLVLILVGIMLGIMVFCIWYTIRTRQKLQKLYNRDIANIKNDMLEFKNAIRQRREEETHQWNEWAISFSQASDKEHRKRTEELKRQCMEAISDAENRMDSSIKNTQSIFTSAVESQRRAVDLYGQQLVHAEKQMTAIVDQLRNQSVSDTADQPPDLNMPPT